jgi:hypothetical protein
MSLVGLSAWQEPLQRPIGQARVLHDAWEVPLVGTDQGRGYINLARPVNFFPLLLYQ